MVADEENGGPSHAEDNWTTFRLGDVCSKIGSGATPRGGSGVYLVEGEVALIRSQNVYNDGFHRGGLVYLTATHAEQLANVEVMADDLLLNITGDSVARTCQVPPDVLPARVNQHVAIIRPDSTRLSSRYLRYYLISPTMQSEMLSLAGAGATRNALTKGMIESFLVAAPVDVVVQEAIAHILGTLDDKIELNRRMNETLEEMARAIFKSWFVDFEPVRAKAEGRTPPGLDAATAALFPDRFADSPLGPIPKGWKVVAMGEHLEASRGLSYKGAGLTGPDAGYPLHNLNSVLEGGGYKYKGIKHYSGEFKERHLVCAGDVIVANTEQGFDYLLIGYPAIVPNCFGGTCLYSHHLYRLRPLPHSPVRPDWIYHLLMVPLVRDQVVGCTNGTTVNMLSLDGLQRPLFVLPSPALIDRFETLAASMRGKAEANRQQCETLAAIRDVLLPKLLSGEIRVKDAEKMAQEVG